MPLEIDLSRELSQPPIKIITLGGLDKTTSVFHIEFKKESAKDISNLLSNSWAKSTSLVFLLGSIVATFSSNLNYSCFNIGATLIKFF